MVLPSKTPVGEEESNTLLSMVVLSTVDVISDVASGNVALLRDSELSILVLLTVLDFSLVLVVGRTSGVLVVDSSVALDDSRVLLTLEADEESEVVVGVIELSSDKDADEDDAEEDIASDDD